MTKVYVSGSCKNRIMIRCLMNDIKNWGYEIVSDWTTRKESGDIYRKYAQEDIRALKECDCLVYCMDDFKSRGKYFELGYATALGKPIGIYLFLSLSLDNAMKNESIFIRSGMYPIIYDVNNLKTWLANVKTD